MIKDYIFITLRALLSIISIALAYLCMYFFMIESNYYAPLVTLLGVCVLFFIGISCGWLETFDGMTASIVVKALNYILFLIFSYHTYRRLLGVGYYPSVYNLVSYGIVLKMLVFILSVATCTYGISVIINRDMNVFLKIFLSITQYIVILDLIVLISLSIIFYIKDKRRVETYARE